MSTEVKFVHALSICGRLTLDLHSLNNEGTEGNQTLTRQVTVVDEKGDPHTVNAISGDMLKHIQAEHLHSVALSDGLPMCEPAKRMDPNRIAADRAFTARSKGSSDAEVTDDMLRTCAITDLEGILLTEGRATPRNSVVEFGWLVGIPAKTFTESYIHLKRVADAGKQASGDASNLGQNLFHRPVNSGEYALVVHLETSRVGFNDFSRTYCVDDVEREKRYKALLKSILFTILEPNGAQRNTQMPHIVGFRGVISLAHVACPAPTVSALSGDAYANEIESVAASMNKLLGDGAVQVKRFGALAEFASEMTSLISSSRPFKVS